MRTSEKADALLALTRAQTTLAALRLRIMAAAEDVAAWLAHQTQASPRSCRAELHLAGALDARWTRLGAAVAEGSVNLAQAEVVARALDELPDDLDPSLLVQAEEYLVEAAAHHRPEQLRVLGRKILKVIAPEIGEAEEAKQLAREEERAWETTSLTLTRSGDGTTVIVTIDRDALAKDLATAGLLGTEEKITAADARRLACNAQILPAVLGGRSEILDFGRGRRLFPRRSTRPCGCGTSGAVATAARFRRRGVKHII